MYWEHFKLVLTEVAMHAFVCKYISKYIPKNNGKILLVVYINYQFQIRKIMHLPSTTQRNF